MGVKKILSSVLALIMSILSFFAPGMFGKDVDGVKNGDWLAAVVVEFGMDQEDFTKEPYFEDITADNEYFAVVQIAADWEIILPGEKLDLDAYATNAFVAQTITRAVAGVSLNGVGFINNNRKASYAEALKLLKAAKELWLANSDVSETVAEFAPNAGVTDLSKFDYIVDGNTVIYAEENFNLAVGSTFIAGANDANVSGAAYKVLAVEKADGLAYVTVEAVEIEKAVKAVDFEGKVAPDFDKAEVKNQEGKVIQEATVGAAETASAEGVGLLEDGIDAAKKAVGDFLANPKVSFSIKGFKVKAAYQNEYIDGRRQNRVDISVAGNVVNNIRVEKNYSLTDITFDTKYDANLAKLQINEARLVMNYDLKETTVLQGSYATSVVPGDVEYEEDASFLDKVKANLGNLKLVEGGGIKVNVFTFTYPIGTTGLTIEMNVSLTISACGRIEIIVTSNETKGYEIINNKGRYISESTIYDRLYNISGDFQVVLGLDLSLTFLGYKIVDVEVQGGIGAYVLTRVFSISDDPTVAKVYNLPLDIVVEVTAGASGLEDLRFCTNIQLYGILRISVGENSIISKIGLSKTWTIFDRSNGVFAEIHIDDNKVVDSCLYA